MDEQNQLLNEDQENLSDEDMEVPQSIEKVLAFKSERVQTLSVDPDAVVQTVAVEEERDERGIEKLAWKLPDFIKRVGIMKVRQSLRERIERQPKLRRGKELDGMKMIFRIGIAILQYCKEDLLQHDMEGMLRYFQKEMPAKCEADPDYLIGLSMQVKYSSKKMKKLEKDYTSYKAKEQEEMIELRRLRTENKLLRQRIENLELESASLADRLVQGQVTRAQEAEDSYALRRELASLKQT
ncbi:ecotropic viral integration site 5 ortholog [Trichonephila clavipes]|nr:ecotropic viral integration site 5 ortholog [Trichonephila clavipes]